MVTLSSPDLLRRCVFMIDSGSGVNLLKESSIDITIPWEDERSHLLHGISSLPVGTLGSVSIQLMGKPTLFHIVRDSVGFVQDGILGNQFLQDRTASINFKDRYLHYDNSAIPFSEITSTRITKRTISPFFVNVTNPEETSGYIPRTTLTKGLFFGDAIVTNVKGRAYLPIVNTTDTDYKVEIPSLELEDFDLVDPSNIDTCNSSDYKEEESKNHSAQTLGHGADDSCVIRNKIHESNDTLVGNSLAENRAKPESNGTLAKNLPAENHFEAGQLTETPGKTGAVAVSNLLYFCEINQDNEDRLFEIKNLLRLDHLNSEEKDSILSLIARHADRFHLPKENLGATNAAEHSIPTINDVPIHTKQYRFPPVHKAEIDSQVNKLLSSDMIEYSSSPYNSPVWIVPKKPDSLGNKQWRMVIDYRNLNEKTIGDAYPLPNITDILDQLGSAKYFSVLDLASGFHQIPMAPKDAPKTAFSTPYGHYQFKRMPFGLKNAPSTFQRLMDNVLSGLQGNELFVYMDDIVIYARSLKEHEVKFERLMKRLKAANLQLQPDKCEFLRQEVAYLGHIICADGVRPDPNKVEAVIKFPVPKNVKNIKQFLGLVGYYRKFIPNFSKIAKPLTDLLKKDTIFNWQQKHTEAFDILRLSLCSEPILQYPDFNKPFTLTTDASGYAIGGVLSQTCTGQDLPVAYTSRTLNKAEQNYSTIEKECLAIIYCINHFRPYLYGRKFTIVTDHKPLVWLHSVKDPSSRLWKWRTKLAEYEYEIKYKKGQLNYNADALSRNPPDVVALPLSTNDVTPPRPPSPDVIIEECSENGDSDDEDNENGSSHNEYDPNQFTETDNEGDEPSYEEIIEPTHIQRNIVPTTQGEQPLVRLTVKETRDNLLDRPDNHVIFIHLNGTPFDSGAREYQKRNLLPKYQNLNYERANVIMRKRKYVLISIPIKFNQRTPIEPQTLDNSLQSLVDVITELQLTSLSISKTNFFDDLPWQYVEKRLRAHLTDIPLNLIICKNLIRTPDPQTREALITESHASACGGHKGVTKTYNRLRVNYYWNTMKRDIQKFIQRCRLCQLKKLTRVKTKQPMIITDTPGEAFDKLSLDIVGPLPITRNGSRYILTMQDLLTKYSLAVPLGEATSLTIADAFAKKFICIYGTPKAILTDQGTNFLSSLIRSLTRRFGIQHFKTTAYHPQSNGSLERSHHVLMEYLRTQVEKEENWDEYMELAMFSYNTSVHEGTQYSPFELVFGRLARLPSAHLPIDEILETTYYEYLSNLFNKLRDLQEDARLNLTKAKQRSKHYYDKKSHPQRFEVGSYVFLLKEPFKGKFAAQYRGPYLITEILPNNNVKLLIGRQTRIVHTDKLKIAHIDPG
ncbi:uncharacterized protein LOC118647611 [Monomorium pharaonis]|uniref:uncharacterized protein LOC118647611 n=1 Tax=Monomorium pharaonis TaxID=307658 RepID=UPI0017476B72|nr:uncharacterized protein LOC118647611 [Monomorium pharaonis]